MSSKPIAPTNCNPSDAPASKAAIATPHPDAARAGAEILAGGGNAIDAAVAAVLVMGIVAPSQVGIGGYGGSMVAYLAEQQKLVALDFDSRCPLAFREEMLAGDPKRWLDGYLAVSVPGVVAGLDRALADFGTKGWKEVAAPAVRLAETGTDVDGATQQQIHDKLISRTDEASIRAAFPSGPPRAGQRWIMKDLAGLLRRFGDEGAETFYRGEVAERIVRQVREHGGILSMEDMQQFQAKRVEPISIDYRNSTIATPPPPSGGITTLQILKTLEQFDIAALPAFGAQYLHLFAEAAKLCWRDRERALGDPEFVDIPIDALLSEESARRRAAAIGARAASGQPAQTPGGSHTVNVSVVDRAGNIVSLTATHGWQFGSGVVIDGLGLILGHGMSRFDTTPGSPNAPRPGKRMHHNMSPMLVTRGGAPVAAAGMAGGPKIITVTGQILVAMLDFHATAEQAVTMPRVHTEGAEPLSVSKSMPDEIVHELESLGHSVTRGQEVGGPPDMIGGFACAVMTGGTGAAPQAASTAGRDAAAVL